MLPRGRSGGTWYLRAPAAIATVLTLSTAAAATSGFTPGGATFVVGGRQPQDEAVLQARREQYSLLVMTAARSPDRVVAAVHLRVLDARRRVVFARVLSEPWLLLNLPEGRYEIEAASQDRVQRQPVVIVPDDHQAMVFYLDGTAVMPAD